MTLSKIEFVLDGEHTITARWPVVPQVGNTLSMSRIIEGASTKATSYRVTHVVFDCAHFGEHPYGYLAGDPTVTVYLETIS